MERAVLRIVKAGLLAVGCATVGFSVEHLLDHTGSTDSGASVVLAAASVVALTALAIRKRQIAVRLPSRALQADGNLTSVGTVLAAVTLGGTAAASTFGWWWADPAAALVLGVGAIVIGIRISAEP